MYIYISIYILYILYICIYKYIYIQIYTYIHIYTYIYMYIYIYVYKLLCHLQKCQYIYIKNKTFISKRVILRFLPDLRRLFEVLKETEI